MKPIPTLTCAGILLVGLSLTACGSLSTMDSGSAFSQTKLPPSVQVPPGFRVAMETAAKGDIAYVCRAKPEQSDQFEWFFAGPDAGLQNRQGQVVGKYYGPPATWEASDGSKVTGTQLAVASAGAGNIPLQLVKAAPASGSGLLQGTEYIQRVATRGGIAPSDVCNAQSLGQRKIVRYSADYIFWRKA